MHARKIIAILLICTSQSTAGPLDSFFKKLGASSNMTGAGAFKDQAAGYYTGGGFALRQGSTTINPINISLPKIGAGCNNMDMYMGSFSFIKSEQLVNMLRQIKSGVPTYATQLGLKTMAPMIETTLAEIRGYVQDMNALMLNSCQMSQQIVGGLWPKGTAASEQICMDSKRSGNNDWFGARNHCSKGAVPQEIERAKAKHRDLMMGEYNLVWHVVRKMEGYSKESQNELAEFVMSVVGTLISRKEGDQFRVRTIEPRADQKEFVSAYLKGGTTSLLKCDEHHKCLSPSITQVSIEAGQGKHLTTMKDKVWHRINDLRNKYLSKENVTEDDIGFLNDSVNLPIYKYIQVSAAAGTQFMLQDSAEYIAAAVLLAQFEKITTEVLEAIDTLQKVQLDDSAIESFKRNIQDMRSRLQMMLSEANHGSIYTLNTAIRAIEQQTIAQNS